MGTLETAGRNLACDAVVDALDGGTIELQTSGDVEVATLSFGTPAFGAAVAGVATANAITADSSATGGIVTKAVYKNSGGTAIYTATAGEAGSGAEVIMTSTTIAATETVSITSLTHTQPAS